MSHDAFVSYSHAADGALAAALQRALARIGKPWYRRRALNVFRDKTNLGASPSLWGAIEAALAVSRWLVLMASPESAASPWVQREVRWWLEHRTPDRLLIVLSAGTLHWRNDQQRFDAAASTALPPDLHDRLSAEPLYVDMRWARGAPPTALADSRFRAAVLDIASAVHGRPKDELDGDDLRQHRRTLRLAVGGVVMLALTAGGLAWSAWLAMTQRDEARAQAEAALSGRLAAQVQISQDLAPDLLVRNTLLAVEALRRAPSSEAFEALRAGLRLLPLPIGRVFQDSPSASVDVSPDGTRAVSAFRLDGNAGYRALVVDTRDGRVVLRVTESRPIERLRLSPDGRRLLMQLLGPEDGGHHRTGPDEVVVWHVDGQREEQRLVTEERVSALAISADGRLFAVGSRDGDVSLWQLPGEDAEPAPSVRLRSRHSHGVAITAVALSRDGGVVALDQRGRSLRWNRTFGGRPVVRDTGVGSSEDVALSPDGRTVIWRDATSRVHVGSIDGTAPAGPTEPARIVHDRGSQSIGLAFAGSSVASLGSDRTARVWALPGGREIARVVTDGKHTALAASADGRVLMVSGTGDSARAFRYLGPQQPAGIWSLAELSGAPGRDAVVSGTTWILHVEPGDMVAQHSLAAPVSAVTLDGRGRTLAATSGVHPLWRSLLAHPPPHRSTASVRGRAVVWDLAAAEVIADTALPGNPVSASLGADGGSLAVLGWEGKLHLVKPADGGVRGPAAVSSSASPSKTNVAAATAVAEIGEYARRVLLRADGRRVGAAGESGGVVLDLPERQRRFEASRPRAVVGFDAALSQVLVRETPSDGSGVLSRRVAVDNAVEMSRTGSHFALGEASVALSSDAARVAVPDSMHGSGFQVLDTTSGLEVFASPDAHTQSISGMVFTPDGTHLATASLDGTARIWNLGTRSEQSRLVFDSPVLALGFSGDGRMIAIGTENGDVLVTFWQARDLVEQACQRLTRNLSEDEWRRFMGPAPLRPTCPPGPAGEQLAVGK